MAQDSPTPRHLFPGPTGSRVALVICGALLTVLLPIGAVALPSSNWAHQICPLLGAFSGLCLAILVGFDIFRPQALTPARVRVAVRVLWASMGAAILLGVLGFFA